MRSLLLSCLRYFPLPSHNNLQSETMHASSALISMRDVQR